VSKFHMYLEWTRRPRTPMKLSLQLL